MQSDLRSSFTHAFIALIVLSVIDVVSTMLALSLGAHEGNIIAQVLIAHGGIIPAEWLGLIIPLKIFVLVFGAWRLKSNSEWKLRQVSGIWWVVGVYSLGMVLNIIHIFMLL